MSDEVVAGLFALAAALLSAWLIQGGANTQLRKEIIEEMDLLDRLPTDSPHRRACERRLGRLLEQHAPTSFERFPRALFLACFAYILGLGLTLAGVWLLFGSEPLEAALKSLVALAGIALMAAAARTMSLVATMPPVDDGEARRH